MKSEKKSNLVKNYEGNYKKNILKISKTKSKKNYLNKFKETSEQKNIDNKNSLDLKKPSENISKPKSFLFKESQNFNSEYEKNFWTKLNEILFDDKKISDSQNQQIKTDLLENEEVQLEENIETDLKPISQKEILNSFKALFNET